MEGTPELSPPLSKGTTHTQLGKVSFCNQFLVLFALLVIQCFTASHYLVGSRAFVDTAQNSSIQTPPYPPATHHYESRWNLIRA